MFPLPMPRSGFAAACFMYLATLLVPASAIASTNQGTAYRLEDGAPAYRETHLLYESGGMPARLVLYRCINGSAFARKTVVERTDAVTPDFDFIDGRSGYREGVRSISRGREVYWRKSSTTVEKTRRIDVPARAVIDAGFDAMVRAHWSQLASASGIGANFLLPSALRFLKVTIQRAKDAPEAGVTQLRMKLDTWYGFAVPDTELAYRTSDRRLLRFKGIGNIHDAQGRNQAVRIEFPGGLQGRQASAAEIDAARNMPLTGRCEA